MYPFDDPIFWFGWIGIGMTWYATYKWRQAIRMGQLTLKLWDAEKYHIPLSVKDRALIEKLRKKYKMKPSGAYV